MREALLIVGMALVTFGVRYPVLAVSGKIDLPGPVLRALRYVPAAVLTAIVAPAVLMPEHKLWIGYTNAHLIAGMVTGLVAWRTRHFLLTFVIGMAVFLAWRAVLGML